MKRLIEVEMDGQAVAAEFDHLREAVKKQRDVRRHFPDFLLHPN